MTYILNIDTSTTNCSVALSKNGKVIGLKEDNSLEYSHAERLHIYIDEVLETAQISKNQLNAISIKEVIPPAIAALDSVSIVAL